MQKAVSCASWKHSRGIVQVAAVHVSMYLPNSLSKVSPETLPFLSLLGSSFSQLQLLSHPTFLCHPGGSAGWGAQGLVKGNGNHAIPTASPAFGLKARCFKKLKIQHVFPPAVCVERPEEAASLLHLLLLGAVLEEGALGGTRVGLSCSEPGPCPGTTSVRSWRVWPHQVFPAT